MTDRRPVPDAAARLRALAPEVSFIVQAPAGSGKTELLIQRLLVLLAAVERPEEIAAITFTRKAAAEMRRRVFAALEAARVATRPDEPHRAFTWDLARAAVARDAQKGWNLEANASRLRIQTFDSLCGSLTRQMPVLSRFGGQPATLEDAGPLYRDAARETLAGLEGEGEVAEAIAQLLGHLGHDHRTAESLLVDILQRREHWLPFLLAIDRATLEASLRTVRRELVDHAVRQLVAADAMPEGIAGDVDPQHWCDFAKGHLKQDGDWRKASAMGKRLGYPEGALLEALDGLRQMPPAQYEDGQWSALEAIARVARDAVARLKVAFAHRGEADFAEIAQGALEALGTGDCPTDLLLALDFRIRHVLVDEFQDTSRTQVDLLEKITAGWEPGDGRTLFVVGDPMQSIYRFREAEVGLFLRAQREGLGGVPLEPLRLEANFRSQAGIVEWVNDAFARVMPAEEDIAAGAVGYRSSVAVHEALPAAVTVHSFFDGEADAEAACVARLAAEALADPGPDPARPRSVAILVRARTALARVVPALKARGLRFRAVEIDPLGSRPVVRDLVALTRALVHPADRPAWLAVLRAPWCGLTLADLHALAAPREGASRGETFLEAMADPSRLSAVSPDGRERLARFREALAPALDRRGSRSLRDEVEALWMRLGGPALAGSPAGFAEADAYLDHLASREVAGALEDLAAFEESLAKLHAPADEGAGNRLELMTIHKAKGLEFDTVIVPGLGAGTKAESRRLFLWLDRARAGDGDATELLVGPLSATGADTDAIYAYLQRLEKARASHELGRLLYVAATRARRHLHLVGIAKPGSKDEPGVPVPRRGSSLAKLWPAIADRFVAPAEAGAPREPVAAPPLPPGPRRFSSSFALPPAPPGVAWRPEADDASEDTPVEFSWVGETTRLSGTVVHRWLQRIAEDGLDGWDAKRVRALAPRVKTALRQQGVLEADLDEAAGRVTRALETALGDPKGRWILGPHDWAACEWRVTAVVDGRKRRFAMDRVVRDDRGETWVIDYKSGRHEGAGAEAFLDDERDRYAPKLRDYAKALGGAKAALYFPLVPGWREID